MYDTKKTEHWCSITNTGKENCISRTSLIPHSQVARASHVHPEKLATFRVDAISNKPKIEEQQNCANITLSIDILIIDHGKERHNCD